MDPTYAVGSKRDRLLVAAGHDLEAAIVHVHVVDGHEECLVLDRPGMVVRRRVNVGVKPARPAGLLVVDLLLEEERTLAHEFRENARQALAAEQ